MPTSKHQISKADGWTKVADSADDFLMENTDRVATVYYRFDTAAPAADAAAHTLKPGGFAVRAGVTGDVYARVNAESAVTIVVS